MIPSCGFREIEIRERMTNIGGLTEHLEQMLMQHAVWWVFQSMAGVRTIPVVNPDSDMK
jgi:hypothetical protein